MTDFTRRLLERLDRFRDLPNYQLECRADIFIAMWLPQVLEAVTGRAIDPRLVPEFPVQRMLVRGGRDPGPAIHIDYLAVSADLQDAWLIGIKSDMGHRDPDQDDAMRTARRHGWSMIVRALCEVIRSGKREQQRDQRYRHLSSLLGDLGLLQVPADINEHIYGSGRAALTGRLGQIVPTAANPRLQILYIQPEAKTTESAIDFARFAAELERLSDDDARTFAEYLRRWVTPPGARRPPLS
ncbi:MAG: hypothetical protein OEZ06_22890 [Myxococcales bacterium]|nr:hypothetical protein [Myxococcales bacterium]